MVVPFPAAGTGGPGRPACVDSEQITDRRRTVLDHHHHHRASTPLLHYSCRKKGQTFQKEVKNDPQLTVPDHYYYHWASTLLLHQVGAKKELPILVT